MKSPRGFTYFVLIYSVFMGFCMFVLSTMSLTAYGCGFDFTAKPTIYMLHIIYFRTANCYTTIDWGLLSSGLQNIALQPVMPAESQAVIRTMVFSVLYLVLSILLIVTAFLGFAGLRKTGRSKHIIFWLFFLPFIIVSIAIVILDLTTAGWYLFDYFTSLGINGFMRILEIENTDQIRPILINVPIATRTVPSIILFAATSKVVLFLVLNIFIVFVFPKVAWLVARGNAGVIRTVRKVKQKKAVKTVSESTPNVAVTVSQAEQTVDAPPSQNQPTPNQPAPDANTYDSPPPLNPFLTMSKKQETHF